MTQGGPMLMIIEATTIQFIWSLGILFEVIRETLEMETPCRVEANSWNLYLAFGRLLGDHFATGRQDCWLDDGLYYLPYPTEYVLN